MYGKNWKGFCLFVCLCLPHVYYTKISKYAWGLSFLSISSLLDCNDGCPPHSSRQFLIESISHSLCHPFHVQNSISRMLSHHFPRPYSSARSQFVSYLNGELESIKVISKIRFFEQISRTQELSKTNASLREDKMSWLKCQDRIRKCWTFVQTTIWDFQVIQRWVQRQIMPFIVHMGLI